MKKLVVLFLVVALLLVGGGTVAAVPDRLGMSAAVVEPQAAQKGVMGIVVSNLNPRIAELLGLEKVKGVLVVRVAQGSPAAAAGLKLRDVITGVNGAPVANVGELRKALAGAADPQVTLAILREGAAQNVSVARKLAEEWLLITGPAWLPEITGIKASEAFQHYLGTQTTFTDKDGKKHTIIATPGIVADVKENSLTITPNGQRSPVTFTVTANTVINLPGRKLSGIKAGDKVAVTTVDGSQEARRIAAGPRIGKRLLKLDKSTGRML